MLHFISVENRTERVSSSSGWVGFSPAEPKSSGVGTMPTPNSSSQKRFTATRAVSGFSGEAIHFARSRRVGFPDSAFRRGKTWGVSEASITWPLSSQLPRLKKVVTRECSGGRSVMTGILMFGIFPSAAVASRSSRRAETIPGSACLSIHAGSALRAMRPRFATMGNDAMYVPPLCKVRRRVSPGARAADFSRTKVAWRGRKNL